MEAMTVLVLWPIKYLKKGKNMYVGYYLINKFKLIYKPTYISTVNNIVCSYTYV